VLARRLGQSLRVRPPQTAEYLRLIFEAGAGPDVIMLLGTWPQLYTDSLVDVSDVAEEIGRAQGGYYDTQRILATVGSKWIGVPWAVGGGLVTYRKSWLGEAGAEKSTEASEAAARP
jgi:ABC-type glycerol-3-phosphate transport system substrate-binding protein